MKAPSGLTSCLPDQSRPARPLDTPWADHRVGTYDWVSSGEDYQDPAYVRRKVDHYQALGARVLGFSPQLGGYALYDSELIPRVPDLRYDLFGALVEECHRRDVRVMGFWLATNAANAVQLSQHPDWQQLGPDGEPTGCVCYVSPFGRYTYAHVREVVRRYPIDAVYLDQFTVGCFCPYCRHRFQQRFGVPLALDPGLRPSRSGGWAVDEAELTGAAAASEAKVPPALFRTFVDENAHSVMRNVRRAIDGERPGVRYFQGKVWGTMARRYRRYLDGLLPEVLWWTVGGDVYTLSLHRQVTRAYAGLPMLDPVKYDLGISRRSRPLAEGKVLLAQAAANRCSPFLRDHHVSQLSGRTEALGAWMAQLAEILGQRQQASPVGYVALLHSQRSEEGHSHDLGPAMRGLYKLFLQRHLPVQVLTEEMVAAGGLSGHAVLVLPECPRVDPCVAGAVQAFLEAGGGVVAIGRVATDGQGTPGDPLCQVLGLSIVAQAGEERRGAAPSLGGTVAIPAHTGQPFQYGRVRGAHPIGAGLDGVPVTFTGGYLEVDYAPDFTVVAEVVAHDLRKGQAPYFNRRIFWPGEAVAPLLAVRQAGAGRIVHVAAPLGALDHRVESLAVDDLLIEAVRWAAGRPPAVALPHGPASLRLDVDWDASRRRYLVLLTNLATNDLREGLIRWVTPARSVEVLVRTGGRAIASATLASGAPAAVRPAEDGYLVTVPAVEYLEWLAITLA